MLEVRAAAPSASGDEWHAVVQPPRRRWWHVAFNPGGTLALAEQTVVERWWIELEDGEETVLTRALVERLAARCAADSKAWGTDVTWEYRVRDDADRGDDSVVLRAFCP